MGSHFHRATTNAMMTANALYFWSRGYSCRDWAQYPFSAKCGCDKNTFVTVHYLKKVDTDEVVDAQCKPPHIVDHNIIEQVYGMIHIRYTQCFTHVSNQGLYWLFLLI